MSVRHRHGLGGELAELGFVETTVGRRRFYLVPQLAARASEIDRFATALKSSSAPGAGNRGSASRLVLEGVPPLFVRRYLRGGLIRFAVSEIYTGIRPRPLRELRVTALAYRRGLPVVEPLGAIVEEAAFGLYRGWLLTRALEGATLWKLLLHHADAALRRQALRLARAGIDRAHQGGLLHADLNFHNLLLCKEDRPPRVVILDLDKARLYPAPLPEAARRSNFKRLARSARRLSGAGAILSAEERRLIGIG